MMLQLREPILRSHPNGNELKNNGNELRNKVRLKCLPGKGQEQLFRSPIKIGSVALTDADAAYLYRSFVSCSNIEQLMDELDLA
jgi:hypothetical protein